MRRRGWVALLGGAALVWPRQAAACGACGAGDSALTATGAELPTGFGLAASADVRAGSVRIGGANGLAIDEQRLDLGVSLATRRVDLAVALPYLRRTVRIALGPADTRLAMGDAEIRAQGFVSAAIHDSAPRALALFGGLRLPTAPEQFAGRDPLPAALQPGSGALTPFIGGLYSVAWGAWVARAAGGLYLPFAVRAGPHAGSQFRTNASIQRGLGRYLATRAGFQAKLEASTTAGGEDDPNSGGFIAFVSTEGIITPARGLTVTVGAHFPAIQLLRGSHQQGTILAAGAAYAF